MLCLLLLPLISLELLILWNLSKLDFRVFLIFNIGHDGKCSTQNVVPKYEGINNALRVIYKSEGIKGLYKGFYISLLSQASTMSFFFWQYIIFYLRYETRKKIYENQGK
jgi:hypothetical protein